MIWSQTTTGTVATGDARILTAALNFMWTWRGIPSLYLRHRNPVKRGEYADKFSTAGHSAPLTKPVGAYFGDQFADAPNHTVYQHIRKLNAIRRGYTGPSEGQLAMGRQRRG